ncbi:type I-E CRISPR-associated protein Cse1/CasA [Rhodoplanes sp. SY1]|uniref:type I-E CRISPR-associated protein Cse1/CasA n=1 Tax=Rhodoplanes sp. SY1 TaxID=3166646 RepID=UPI0038B4C28B
MVAKAFSLLDQPWLPVVRRDSRSGAVRRDWIRPCDITDRIETEPVVAFDWQRADFDAASRELMIGLLATACPPSDDHEWIDRWRSPPSPDQLEASFAPFAHAFVLDGEGPRFLQDHEDLVAEPQSIAGLLIDSPGENTVEKNLDLFTKRGRIPALARATAAIALFTLQSQAPAGGAGNRVSMRGGGPLTTLALPATPASLWHLLWLNVPSYPGPADGDLHLVFPWLAPTRTSEDKKPPTTPADIDPDGRQCFWGMPRRIRLDFRPAATDELCALTGGQDAVMVEAYRARPWGVSYAAVPHPLSPMYRPKPTDVAWFYTHPQPDGITYRHWVDLVADSDSTASRRRATCVAASRARLGLLRQSRAARLLACGYDMDNMKARGFVEAEMPLFAGPGSQRLDMFARRLVSAAEVVALSMARFVGDALGIDKSDATARASLRERLFTESQTAFFGVIDDAAGRLESDPDQPDFAEPLARRFLDDVLQPTATRLFDEAVPLSDIDTRSLAKAVRARLSLTLMLKGHGRDGAALLSALGLPTEVSAEKKPRKGRRKGAEEPTS